MGTAAGSSRVADGRLVRGQRAWDLILAKAVDLASADGLDSLSLGRLGADLNIRKSGVKGHFTSREDLQLAVIAVLTALVEYDARPGPIRDEPVRLRQRWERLFTTFWRVAERRGQVHPDIDEHQLFYEIAAFITGAILDAQLRDDPTALDRARTAALTRLRPFTTDPHVLPAID